MSAALYDTDWLARLTVKRLAEMNRTRAKVEELERRANLATDYELERRRLRILSHLSDHYHSLGPQLRDMGAYITELKAYLQSVYDAELMGDLLLQDLATEHCVAYTVRLLDLMSDRPKSEAKGSYSVLELASSTLAMFSARPSAVQILMQASAVPVLVKLLSPLFPAAVVINLCNAVGNLSASLDARLALRASGGVGGLVRLLRGDVDAGVQTAAAAALSLLAARDVVVQDSVRYLGGIDHLVALLASGDAYQAEVARCCLVSVRHGNVKNQAEIMTAMRASPALARDVRKMDSASELLRFEYAGTPAKLPSYAADVADFVLTKARPSTASARLATPTYVSKLSLRELGAGGSPLSSPQSPIFAATASTKDYTSLTLPASPPSPTGSDGGWRLGAGSGTASAALAEVESELLRKKHLARFSAEEVCLLLEEMGFDRLDLRGFRIGRINGVRLLGLSEDDLSIDLLLSRSKVLKVQVLQRAVALFDRIASLQDQGRISEVELRLYLAGHGANAGEVNKIVKLLRTLVRTDRFDFITFWDFVTGFDWVTQAFRIYNIPY